MTNIQVGTCNGLPVMVDMPTGMLPIVWKYVELKFDFYKDAPCEYWPYKYVKRPLWTPRSNKPWHTRNGPDKADWLYPYMEGPAAALVALGVASYYTGKPLDVDHRGRPAVNLSLAFFGFENKTAGHATFKITTSSNVRGNSARLYRVAAGAQFDPDTATLCATVTTAPSTIYTMTAGVGTPVPAGTWDFYAVPISLGGQVGIRSGPIQVVIT